MGRHHHVLDIFGGFQKTAGMDNDLAFGRGIGAGIGRLVGGEDQLGHGHRVQPVTGHAHRIQLHLHPPALPADEGGDGYVGLTLDLIFHLGGHPPQQVGLNLLTPERQRQNGYIVDVSRFDQRRGDAAGNPVHVGHELGLEPHNRLLFVLPHVKAHHRHGHARHAGGVDVLHAGNFPQQLLHGTGHPLLHFRGVGAGHLNEDVDHGDDNLGFFLPGKGNHGGHSQKHRGDNDQRGQLGVDEIIGDFSGRTVCFAHFSGSTADPLVSSGDDVVTSRVPSLIPEITST